MLQLSPEGILPHQMSPETKKLVLVLATSTPVTETRKETIKVVETAGVGKDGEESESKYSENLARVLYIQYPVTL